MVLLLLQESRDFVRKCLVILHVNESVTLMMLQPLQQLDLLGEVLEFIIHLPDPVRQVCHLAYLVEVELLLQLLQLALLFLALGFHVLQLFVFVSTYILVYLGLKSCHVVVTVGDLLPQLVHLGVVIALSVLYDHFFIFHLLLLVVTVLDQFVQTGCDFVHLCQQFVV
jgi:hypothetical protein